MENLSLLPFLFPKKGQWIIKKLLFKIIIHVSSVYHVWQVWQSLIVINWRKIKNYFSSVYHVWQVWQSLIVINWKKRKRDYFWKIIIGKRENVVSFGKSFTSSLLSPKKGQWITEKPLFKVIIHVSSIYYHELLLWYFTFYLSCLASMATINRD